MSDLIAYTGARIFDGHAWHDNAALIVDGERIHAIGAVPSGAIRIALEGGYLTPGFIDLQVNGGVVISSVRERLSKTSGSSVIRMRVLASPRSCRL
jgi:N-acetylglucosamine-6-phosphate deacetylase